MGGDAAPKVLVVEDDAGLRLALEHGLAAEGFAVDVAADAGSACRQASEGRPDVVLLDCGLPDVDGGAAACERLRQAHPDGRIVMLTGRTADEAEREALDAGASVFLTKGIALDDLAAQLRSLIPAR